MKREHGSAHTHDRQRVLFLGIASFCAFSLLIVQFFKIQIIQSEKWIRIAESQHYFFVEEPFKRGTFYPNNTLSMAETKICTPLVSDVQKFHLYADPYSLPENHHHDLIQELSTYLALEDTDKQQIQKQLSLRRSRSRQLMMWVDRECRDKIQNWWYSYAKQHKLTRGALYFVSDYQRSYPYGSLLGQVLHTIRDRKQESTKQGIPTGGLEAYFQEQLKGKLGRRRLLRSPRNAFASGELMEAPVHGADIHLTIDIYLQAICEEEITAGVLQAKAKSGWAVMMSPHTGEIYALAQYPHFHPADYQDYFNDKNRIEDSTVKALTYAYEPGSVMKPLTIALGLQANEALEAKGQQKLFDPEEKFSTADGRFPGRSRPIVDTRLHRYLNMYMGLQKSSNIYMGRLVQRMVQTLGNSWYREQLNQTFGFGQPTGVELPAESPGLLPRIGHTHPNGTLEWSTPTPYSLAIGYNLQVNSLQMLRAWAPLANGGYLVEPTLVRKITYPGKEEALLLNKQQTTFPRVLSETTVKEVVKALKYASQTPGSARRGNIPGYTQAAKTGTSRKIVGGEYSKKKHFATFMGFTPVEEPAFLLLVAIDEPDSKGSMLYGGVCAAPVFRQIALRALEYLGVTPDDPYGFPLGDPRHDPKQADWRKETQALEQLYRKWNEA